MRDEGVRVLLKELANSNPGLCVVSTRTEIRELNSFKGDSVLQQHLSPLSNSAGLALLTALGIKGSHEELEEVVNEYLGHALTLTLLSLSLVKYYNGDIRKHDLIVLAKQEIDSIVSSDTVGSLRLLFDSNELDSDDIAEVIGFLSEIYFEISGDRLVIKGMEVIELVEEFEPVLA